LSLLALAPETHAAAPAAVADGAAVDLDGVRFAWPGPAAFTLAVDRFAVPRGARLLLVGPSGSGKSTLLNLVCGIALPSAGRVRVLGTDLARLPGPARDRFRAAHLGIIFQMFNLLPYLSVLDNVLLPLSFAPERRARTGGAAAPGEARRLLARLGLDADGLAGQPAARLSVGQQQRVAAARALIGTPEIVIADEPTSALDRDRQQAFLDLLFAEVARAGASLVMVSHDATLAPLFDRTVRLDEVARPGTRRGEGSAAPP
jgi:putative ABC transport system ATP-binding protein